MRDSRGFTLIELAITLCVLSLAVAFVVPNMVTGTLSSAGLHLVGTIRATSLAALTTNQTHHLHVDLQTGTYWTMAVGHEQERPPNDADIAVHWTLPSGVTVRDVTTAQHGTVTTGQTVIQFHPVRRADSAIIHLADGQNTITLLVDPVTADVLVQEGYHGAPAHVPVPERIQALFVPTLPAGSPAFFPEGSPRS